MSERKCCCSGGCTATCSGVCTGSAPANVKATFSGVANEGCTPCTTLNGTSYVLTPSCLDSVENLCGILCFLPTQLPTGGSPLTCGWAYTGISLVLTCASGTNTYTGTLFVTLNAIAGTWYLSATLVIGGNFVAAWSTTFGSEPACSVITSTTLTFQTQCGVGAGSFPCDFQCDFTGSTITLSAP